MSLKFRKIIAIFICIALICTSSYIYADEIKYNKLNSTIITFTDNDVSASGKYDGYSIDGTKVEFNSPGVYVLKGTCSNGSISVKKNVEGVVLVLDNFSLTSNSSAPLVTKASSDITLHLVGNSYLIDGETDPSAKSYEGAAIKMKSSSKITICGDGVLNIGGDSKNGIKGGSKTSLAINDGTINVNANNNGIAVDDSVLINGGNITINSQGDGIKAVPDVEDVDSVGCVTINGGNININSIGDGIQAESLVTINNGVIDIFTENGYRSKTFNKETMSAKGIKASGDREGVANKIVINGGTISLNTADDAIHSDTNVNIAKGKIDIYTKDDGIHGDNVVKLGIDGGKTRDPEINIYSCYEGIEANNIFGYSGRFYINAIDDGLNTSKDLKNPYFSGNLNGETVQVSSLDNNRCAMYFYNGDYHVICGGDGFDANGNLIFYGGNYVVLSAQAGLLDSPFDSSSNWIIYGGTLLGIGTNPLKEAPTADSQKNITIDDNIKENKVVNVVDGNRLLISQQNIKLTKYIFYSSPDITDNTSIQIGDSINKCFGDSWSHEWDNGVCEEGSVLYTCGNCGKTEQGSTFEYTECKCDGHVEDAIILGDLDGNEIIDANDASMVLEIFKSNEQTPENIAMGDMDGNGVIDANDASLILELYKMNN